MSLHKKVAGLTALGALHQGQGDQGEVQGHDENCLVVRKKLKLIVSCVELLGEDIMTTNMSIINVIWNILN